MLKSMQQNLNQSALNLNIFNLECFSLILTEHIKFVCRLFTKLLNICTLADRSQTKHIYI